MGGRNPLRTRQDLNTSTSPREVGLTPEPRPAGAEDKMSLSRTPPEGVAAAALQAEDQLRTHYRAWRRALHRAKDYRVKVLHVLASDGNGEASGLLSEPARAYKAERCRECAGCKLMLREKACAECNGCKGGRGCEEHHRRCKEWPRIANTFHAGSVVTSVSSQFDVLTADLTKYENTLEQLRDLDLELEEDMDQLPPGSSSRNNPRFNPEGRARELDDERNHLARLSVLLQRHGELATRLQEVAEDDDEPQVVEETQPVEDPVVLTGTQTSRQLIEMFNFNGGGAPGTGALPVDQDDGEERLSTVEEASDSPGVLSRGGWSLDDENDGDRRAVSPSILQTLISRNVTPPWSCGATVYTSTSTAPPIVTSAVFRPPVPGDLRPRIVPTSGRGTQHDSPVLRASISS